METTPTQYRIAVTYWAQPRSVGITDAEVIEESVADLLAGIDAGRIMSFTVEGI